MGKIKVFVSYSWDSDSHQKWVVGLVNKLRDPYGIDATCDVLDTNSNLFRMMVQHIQNDDKFIIVITEAYTKKADGLSGGVGYETNLFYNYIVSNPDKLIVIKRSNAALPFYLQGAKYIDFSQGITEEKMDELVRRIQDQPEYKPVPITNNPKRVSSKSELDDLIPNPYKNSPERLNRYLLEQFDVAIDRLIFLLTETKRVNPEFAFSVNKGKTQVQQYAYGVLGDKKCTRVDTCTVDVSYKNNTKHLLIWAKTGDRYENGIFASMDRYVTSNPFSGYSFWAQVQNDNGNLSIKTYMNFGMEIKNGADIGTYLYKQIKGVIPE